MSRRWVHPFTGENYDVNTIDVMERALSPDAICFDVGASRGAISAQMLRIAWRGHHHLFEPIPILARGLRGMFPERVTVHEVALSDQAGRSDDFHYVLAADGYSGLRRRDYPDDVDPAGVEHISVETARLDDVCEGQAVDFIKIDVEGAETLVVQGGRRLISANRPYIAFEHGGERVGAGYPTTSADLWHELHDLAGLELSTCARWLAGQRPYSKDGFISAVPDEWFFLAYPALQEGHPASSATSAT